jgi:hypothetical protein
MATRLEPNLRLVKVSHDLAKDPSGRARGTEAVSRDGSAPAETGALDSALASAASGEIRNDHSLDTTEAPKHATLLGVAPATRHGIDRSRLFVAPATVTAISRAGKTRYPTEPSIKVKLGDTAKQYDTEQVIPLTKRKDPQANPWQQFEDLGLAPKPRTKKLQMLVVSSYRMLGFGILSLIVFVLVGYIATNAFFYLNKSWVTPVVLSANDDKVVGLQSQLAQQLNERERLVAEFEQAERAVKAEQTFQLQFAKAIKYDAQGRRAALGKVQQLAASAAATRNQIRATNGDYSNQTVSRMEGDYKLGLINRDSMMAGKYQLAQISSANLSLAERQAEFDVRAAELSSQTQSLDALLSDKSQTAALSYDVLKIARDYETSKLALARETSNRERLKSAIQRQETIIKGVTSSAYMKAVADNATVALVPYANMKNVEAGSSLYACRVSMIICREVGTVKEILPGEVNVKHPNKESMVRGRMISMQMTEPQAAQDEVLFVGGKPLGL